MREGEMNQLATGEDKKKARLSKREQRESDRSKAEARRRARKAREDQNRARELKRQAGETGPAVSRGEDKAVANSGLPTETVLAEDGSLTAVEYKGYSFRGIPQNLVRGAERFSRDYEAAFGGLRCRGFEPGVDCAPSHAGHLRNLEAQTRIKQLRGHISGRDFTILEAVVIVGAGPADLQKLGGPKHVVITSEITRILRTVSAFYDGKPQRGDSLLVAASRVIRAVSEDREPALADLRAMGRA